jgi:sigma-B regulation protein RsbU (phosphoserine phosphatase)
VRHVDDAKTNPAGAAEVDWPTLIDHKTCVQADELMERVYRKFQETDTAFMAVLDQERAIGFCARDEIGMKLGSKYGFSLFSRTPVRKHMVVEPLFIASNQPWADVLQRVFSRTGI